MPGDDPREKLRDLTNRLSNETDENRRQELRRQIQQLERQAQAQDRERTLQTAAEMKELYSDPSKKTQK